MPRLLLAFFLLSTPCFAQAWSGIIAPARATDWTYAGLPGDLPPDGSWTQSGATIKACGASGSPVSPSACGIAAALATCGTNHYVLLAGTTASPAEFYLNGSINVPSNCVLRGGGANATRLHASASGSYSCSAIVCIEGTLVYDGYCSAGTVWPCPPGKFVAGYSQLANWTSGFSQGSTSIKLDNVTGITLNVTPITLDQCDTGYSGTASNVYCTPTAGFITAASVYSGGGGSGYAVNDTGTINPTTPALFGAAYGTGTATYKVTSVSGGAVTGFSITNGGGGYTYTSGQPTTTTSTSGGGTGFQVNITGVSAYDNNGVFDNAVDMIGANENPSNAGRSARQENEMVLATAISGTGPYTVTINRPIMEPNWASSQGPQAWWGTGTVINAGVENMELDESAVNTGNGLSAVNASNATRVWITGIASNTSDFFHVRAQTVQNLLVANNYFYGTLYAGTTSYGIGSLGEVENSLFENNILQAIVDPLNPDGTCTGCVFAYNFSVNDYDSASSFAFASSPMHSTATDYILEEGNIGQGSNQDAIHGPHFFDTYYRNYFVGYESNNGTMPTNITIPVIVAAFSRYNNYLANVLGTAGYHTIYQCIPASPSQRYCSTDYGTGPGNVHIWDIGFAHVAQLDYNNAVPLPNDPLTASSFYRYGNYDVVNGAVQWNASEVPTADPHFPNPVPSSHNFPASFYNGATSASANCGTGLAFWKNPTTGTCPQYPPIGPDVTSGDIGMCNGGTYNWSRALSSSQCAGGTLTASANDGYANSNPAMRCYLNQMGGTPDGTGSFNSKFNAAACYASDGGSGGGGGGGSQAPNPPSNLTATVQ